MATDHVSTQITAQRLIELARTLDNTTHRLRSHVVDSFANEYGWSRATVYRRLRKVGWSSGRKTRADKGNTSQDMNSLMELCATMRLGVRKNGKITMQVPNARSMLQANGRDFNVSNGRLNMLLKERGMDIASQKQDRPYQPQRSIHPNHAHQVDPSLCILYYLKDGSQHIMRDDLFYKNKPENVARIENFRVWRYVLTDHYSSTIITKYYMARGETQANLYDFLLYAWGRSEGRVFHGVPKILVWDKGSANTASAIKLALRALDVVDIPHTKGNPRAKGGVEQSNNLVEKLFESRLKYEPVSNVDELNNAAEAWYNAYNSDSIPHYDSRLSRPQMAQPKARYALWQIIKKDQLRILPDEDLCRYLLSAEAVERKVKPDLTISFRHPSRKRTIYYDLAGIDGVYINAIVKVSPLVYGDAQILLYVHNHLDEEITHIIDPVKADPFSGFPENAAIIGEEFKARPDTIIEKAGKEADRKAFPGLHLDDIEKAKDKNKVPFEGKIDAHSHLHNVKTPSYMQRPGSELNIPNRRDVEIKPLSHIEACRRLLTELGPSDDINYHALVSQWYPDGVPEDEFNNLVSRITQPQTTLSVVNGGNQVG